MPEEQTGSYSGSTKKFWDRYSIKSGRDQPGNPHEQGEKKPSQKTSLSPHKAREILAHGEVHGKSISKAQRGFFGAVAGKGKK